MRTNVVRTLAKKGLKSNNRKFYIEQIARELGILTKFERNKFHGKKHLNAGEDVACQIIELRHKRKMTAKECAKAVHISHMTQTRLESGKGTVKIKILEQYANHFNRKLIIRFISKKESKPHETTPALHRSAEGLRVKKR